jgi:RNA polymerase sigma-70 factor, ECF subfamily
VNPFGTAAGRLAAMIESGGALVASGGFVLSGGALCGGAASGGAASGGVVSGGAGGAVSGGAGSGVTARRLLASQIALSEPVALPKQGVLAEHSSNEDCASAPRSAANFEPGLIRAAADCSPPARQLVVTDRPNTVDAPVQRIMRERDKRLTRVVNQHMGFVERLLRNLGVPDAEIDDAAQRTFIVVANRLDDIVEGAEKSFLFRSARHMASHVRRSAARHRSLEPLDDQLASLQDTPEQLIGQKKARLLLDGILAAMPEELRVVFTLYEFEGLKMLEIAEMLEIPSGTVASRLRRARKLFKGGLTRFEATEKHKLRHKVGA